MITNGKITIFHAVYDHKTQQDIWEVKQYPHVHISVISKTEQDGRGRESADVVNIRIPTSEDRVVCTGDKIYLGKSSSPSAPKGCHTVTSVSDNRHGSRKLWHWRVICE